MTSTQTAVWAVGLIAQLGLFLLLFRRGVAREARLFTLLLAFYCVRSVLLFVASRQPSWAGLGELAGGLALIDLLLQVTLAAALGFAVLRVAGLKPLAAALAFAAAALLSAAFARALAAALPVHTPAPADRGVLMTGSLFCLLFVLCIALKTGGLRRILLAGLAFAGGGGVLAQSGRAIAGAARDAAAFRLWSYVGALAYLAAVGFWLWRLRADPAADARAGRPATYAGVRLETRPHTIGRCSR